MSARALAAALLILAVASVSHGETLLVLQSDGAGDFLTDGIDATFLPADGTFSADRRGDEGVTVVFDDAGFGNWYLDFAAPGDVPLTVGTYPDAVGVIDNGPTQPGLEIMLGGGGCMELTGAFTVSEIQYGVGDEITSFAAEFVQRCRFSTGQLAGAVRFNASDALPDPADADADGALDIGDNCPGIPNANQNDADLDFVGDVCDLESSASFVLLEGAENGIGQGQRFHFNAGTGQVRVVNRLGTSVEFEVDDDAGNGFHLEFVAPGEVPPPVGVYEDALRFADETHPGIDIGGNGAGCGDLTGRFEVFEAEYAPNGDVLRFSADYEQTCIGAQDSVTGSVRWRAPFRPAPPGDLDGDGWLTADDNCPGVGNPAQFDSDNDGQGDFCGLGKSAQKCVNGFNKSVSAVVKAQNAQNLACQKNAQKGATTKLGTPATAQDCLSNDVGGKVAKAGAKLAAVDGASCADAVEFGHGDAATAGGAAGQAQRNLMADLFGANLDTAIVATATDPVGAKCREEVAKRTHLAVDALWKLTLKQKKALLSGKKVLAAIDAEMLADGLVDYLGSDPKGAVTKPFAALAAGAAKRCTGVADLAAAFPGCAPADLPALNACAERSARCRFCQVLVVADGLATIDCDLFDDASADASCQQTP